MPLVCNTQHTRLLIVIEHKAGLIVTRLSRGQQPKFQTEIWT